MLHSFATSRVWRMRLKTLKVEKPGVTKVELIEYDVQGSIPRPDNKWR